MLTLQTTNFQLIVVYLSKESDKKEVARQIKEVLDLSKAQVIVGDFNFDSREKNHLISYFTSLGLQQMVKEATHEEGRTIDQLYVTTDLNVQIDVQFKYFSDHAALQIKVTE